METNRIPGSLAVGSLQDVAIETLVRFHGLDVVQLADAELEISSVICCQLDAEIDVGVGAVRLHNDSRRVLATIFVWPRLNRHQLTAPQHNTTPHNTTRRLNLSDSHFGV